MNIDEFTKDFEKILTATERPSRYIGDEFGSYDKDFNKAKTRFVFAYPDKYEIGISNFGGKILYDLINKEDDLMCDRTYAPEIDFLNLLKENNKLLYSHEAKKTIKDFDFIGFGLQYEMNYTTVLKMLEISGINPISNLRKENDPIIAAGGPCVSNPQPMSKFIDIFMIGDGEEVVIEIMRKYQTLKGQKREDIIKELAKIEGIYAPLVDNFTKKRTVKLTKENHPTISPIPHFSSIHDRATIELRRGCGRMCRFCQASHINLPVRERRSKDVIELAKEYVKNTGYDEYSLLSLSSNDHTNIETILENLNCHFKDTGINVSLPSQRADKFSLKLAQLASCERKAATTIAPEAGSQRMRDVINKNLSEDEIINATISCLKNGWNKIKYYFIIGLPFENKEDLKAIIDLILKVNEKCRENGLKYPQITCSMSIFVPKPFTPFQWAGQDKLDVIEEKIKFLKAYKEEKKLKNVRLNFHNTKTTMLEAYFARADKSACELIQKMYEKGAYLEAWDENLNFEMYLDTAKELNIDIQNEASREFGEFNVFPWDKINYGVNKSWLFEEYKKAKNATLTVPCEVKCSNCGACQNLKMTKILDV